MIAPWDTVHELRRWLGPLGRYRPGVFRRDMAQGFHNCDAWTLPPWARLLRFSSAEERLLDRLQVQGAVVYDVGAFNGSFSLFFSRRVGESGRVIAFEPRADSFALLVANLKRNGIHNVLPLRLALGAAAGTHSLFMLPGMPTTASLAPEAHTPLRRQTGIAQILPLDQLVESVPLPPPKLIKIDVEGFELEVLRGAAATIERHRPDLLIEVHGDGCGQKTRHMEAICRQLHPLGYALLHAESGASLAIPAPAAIHGGHIFAHATL